jgi:hypothetical protein
MVALRAVVLEQTLPLVPAIPAQNANRVNSLEATKMTFLPVVLLLKQKLSDLSRKTKLFGK